MGKSHLDFHGKEPPMDLSSMIGAVLSKQRQEDSLLARSIVLLSIGTKNCLLNLKKTASDWRRF